MNRNIKALGLMLFAGLAMSAMFASGASAQSGEFTAGSTTTGHTATVVTGHQYGTENFLTTRNGGATTCTNTGVSFSGSDPDGTAKEITVTPKYTQCESASGLATTVTLNGCHYHFDQPTHLEKHNTWTGNVDLVCPQGNAIDVRVFLFRSGHTSHSVQVCRLSILPKNNMGHVVYHNQPAVSPTKDYLTLDITVQGIKYEEHGSNCPGPDDEQTVVQENCVWEAQVKLKADNPNTPASDDHDFWISTAQ